MAEQTSWTKPGSVSSAERAPPPSVSRASKTQTEQPARASSIPAASPFGPDPTMTASNSISVLYTRLQMLRPPLPALRLTSHGGWSARAARFGDGSAAQNGRALRNRRATRSINYADDYSLRLFSFVAPRNRSPRGIDPGNPE